MTNILRVMRVELVKINQETILSKEYVPGRS